MRLLRSIDTSAAALACFQPLASVLKHTNRQGTIRYVHGSNTNLVYLGWTCYFSHPLTSEHLVPLLLIQIPSVFLA